MVYVYAIVAALCFTAGFSVEAYRWHSSDLAREKAGLTSALKTEQVNQVEVIKYVDRIVEVKSEPTVVVKSRLVDRVCPSSGPGVPGIANPDASRRAAAADQLAGELKACLANTAKLQALQAQVAPQLPKGK